VVQVARRSALLATVLLLAAVTATPARAIGASGPPVSIDNPTCSFDAFNVDQAQDGAGVTHGFSTLWGSDCNTTFVIRYFEGSGAGWTVEDTPYRGFVVATAWDTTGSYLLYVDRSLNLRITKRQSNGVYIQGRLLSTVANIGPDGSGAQGDVVASGGRWWAVWREHVAAGGGAGSEFDQTELFQAYTVGGTYVPRERITTNPSWDRAPSLALTPGTTFPARLVWARGGSDFGGGGGDTDLRRALGDEDGGWVSTTLATAGSLNFWPDVAVSGTTTYVTWNRDGRTVQANNATGAFLSHTFTTPAVQHQRPRIAVAPGQVVVGWTTQAAVFRAFVAERTGGSWTGAAASPTGLSRLQFLTGVTTTGGTATATIVSLTSQLYSATET
jgi:hypothetical protein